MIEPLGDPGVETGISHLFFRATGLDDSQRTHRWFPRKAELPTSNWSS
jgi:hypothetical protein